MGRAGAAGAAASGSAPGAGGGCAGEAAGGGGGRRARGALGGPGGGRAAARTMLSFDEALKRAGEFGRFQRRVFLLLCLTGVTFAFLFVGVVFLGRRPERYWCRGPGAAALAERCGWSPEEEWNRTAPPGARCRRFLLEEANASAAAAPAAGALSCADPLAAFPNRSAPLVACGGGWRYAQAPATIVSEVSARRHGTHAAVRPDAPAPRLHAGGERTVLREYGRRPREGPPRPGPAGSLWGRPTFGSAAWRMPFVQFSVRVR